MNNLMVKKSGTKPAINLKYIFDVGLFVSHAHAIQRFYMPNMK